MLKQLKIFKQLYIETDINLDLIIAMLQADINDNCILKAENMRLLDGYLTVS